MSNNSMRWTPWVLLLGDIGAVLLFVVIGQRDHNTTDTARPLVGLLRASFPLLLAWVTVAWIVRAIPLKPEDMRLRTLLGRTLNAWFIAAPLALMLRGFLLTRDIPPAFLLVTLTLGSLIVLAWRLVFGWFWHKRANPQTARQEEMGTQI
ncbi:MAG: DUF3054 domain-containing protein [Chloroflexi bacterium]|nr:DUF3054 domain-containing protein [Chloroflexota bacterium]MBP7044858.1 DUF3054 domain-containing protein [Chloroflexota bacterium]